MKSRIWLSIIAVMLLVSTMLGVVGCGEEEDGKKTIYYNNEEDPLVFSTLEVDKVFNPFFSTSGTDSNVVGMTQISMLGNDKNGGVVYGDNEAVVAKDLQIVTTGSGDNEETTYFFVLKNNVKFSNGSALTIKDVLFNLYVYLDPAYTGSSTIYSTDIKGLQAYRTQEQDKDEQDSFMIQFQIAAQARIDALISAVNTIKDENKNGTFNDEVVLEGLDKIAKDPTDTIGTYKHVVEDYKKAKTLFMEELGRDFSNSLNSYADTTFKDEAGTVHKPLKNDIEMFLFNEGYITWNKKDGKLEYACGEEAYTWTKEQAIQYVFDTKIPDALDEVVSYWATATELHTYLTNVALEEAMAGQELKIPNIEGIQFANFSEAVTVNGTTYAVPTYDANGNLTAGNEVLSITINGVDPKAIWNFALTIAPMYYYSDAAHIAAFDYANNKFGVEYASQSFMTNVVKDPAKIGVPVGAGPYAASKASGGLTGVEAGNFYDKGIIYFERNPHYLMGAPKIKKVRFQVVSSSQMLNTLYNGEIDWAEPNAKYETIEELNGKKNEGIGYKTVQTAGYGYIGINAGKVSSMYVRQAIMHSIDTQACVDYYKGEASAIYRPMSLSSWAYPEGTTPYYPYIKGPVPANLEVVNPIYAQYCEDLGKSAGDTFTVAEQEAFIHMLVKDLGGYSLDGASGIYAKGKDVLRFDFTVAGEEQDHPAWTALDEAGKFLNGCGFQITTKNDSNALTKLSTGSLSVWAAAWGSTIDPDMYQVYHKDSKATSTWNWGYREILRDTTEKYAAERALIEELSELIDEARKTNVQAEREAIYKMALDIVMQLAVELPTYQRDDLFAFNTDKLDTGSLTPDSELSSFKGLTSDIHKVSLNVEQ